MPTQETHRSPREEIERLRGRIKELTDQRDDLLYEQVQDERQREATPTRLEELREENARLRSQLAVCTCARVGWSSPTLCAYPVSLGPSGEPSRMCGELAEAGEEYCGPHGETMAMVDALLGEAAGYED